MTERSSLIVSNTDDINTATRVRWTPTVSLTKLVTPLKLAKNEGKSDSRWRTVDRHPFRCPSRLSHQYLETYQTFHCIIAGQCTCKPRQSLQWSANWSSKLSELFIIKTDRGTETQVWTISVVSMIPVGFVINIISLCGEMAKRQGLWLPSQDTTSDAETATDAPVHE